MSHFQNIRRSSLQHAAGIVCLSALLTTGGIPAAAQTDAPAPLSADQAYRDMAVENFTAAIANFKKALDLDPANAVWRMDLAYAYLRANALADAQREFKTVYREQPDHLALALELGYVSQRQQDDASALRYFSEAAGSSDARIADSARAAVEVLNASQLRASRQTAFAELYAAPLYQTRFSNQINTFNAKIGLTPSLYFQPYAGLRLTRDTRSTSGVQPEIYSDNSAVISAGVQAMVPLIHATAYAEAGSAIRLSRFSNGGRAIPDYRTGMYWFRGWGTTMAQAALREPNRFLMTGSGYGDVSYYSRFDDNVIAYGQLRQGVNLPTGRILPMQVLAAVNYIQDSNKDFYNNVVEAGPAIRIAPSRRMTEIQFEAQYVHGVYTRHDAANPYGARYHDFRFSIIWGKGFRR
jgi:tetratricopeptide (TPR) repeat protein